MPKKVNGEIVAMPEMADKKKCDKYIKELCNFVDIDYDDWEDESKFTLDDLYYIVGTIQGMVENKTINFTKDQLLSLSYSQYKLVEIGLEWEKEYDKIMSEGQVIIKKLSNNGPSLY